MFGSVAEGRGVRAGRCGCWVVSLGALVRMKLTSFRDIDRVHVADMLSAGLLTAAVPASLTPELRARLESIEREEAENA